MWIWISTKYAKFHAKRLSRSENIPKSFRWLLFLKHPVDHQRQPMTRCNITRTAWPNSKNFAACSSTVVSILANTKNAVGRSLPLSQWNSDAIQAQQCNLQPVDNNTTSTCMSSQLWKHQLNISAQFAIVVYMDSNRVQNGPYHLQIKFILT